MAGKYQKMISCAVNTGNFQTGFANCATTIEIYNVMNNMDDRFTSRNIFIDDS